jgi:hypothetical protein
MLAEQVWNQRGKMITYLRCDNAKGSLSLEFKDYLSTEVTVSQDIPDDCTELNGTGHRNIVTIINMMCYMLKGAEVPKKVLVQDTIGACYIKNRFAS